MIARPKLSEITWKLAPFSAQAFTFFVCTVANIAPRACHHHAWYLERFGHKYPERRRALIPFLF